MRDKHIIPLLVSLCRAVAYLLRRANAAPDLIDEVEAHGISAGQYGCGEYERVNDAVVPDGFWIRPKQEDATK